MHVISTMGFPPFYTVPIHSGNNSYGALTYVRERRFRSKMSLTPRERVSQIIAIVPSEGVFKVRSVAP